MPDMLLFTYGSLRRDAGERHHPLLRDAEFRGQATTEGRLYRVSWHPGLHVVPGAAPVTGELFAIPDRRRDEVLGHLDAYEGPAFRLEAVTVRTPDGTSLAAWTYAWLGDGADATLVESGDFGHPSPHPSA